MDIHPYQQDYYTACLDIFQSNVPEFFNADEESAFSTYLLNYASHYFVILDKGQAVACGGFDIEGESNRVSLIWGMVHRRLHGQGYGTALLIHRLKALNAHHPDATLMLDTSQNTYRFFEKFGFGVEQIIPDGYGAGLDQYDMTLYMRNLPSSVLP
jgi:ribosomal protein S18 acetylase RimI-like enzyme